MKFHWIISGTSCHANQSENSKHVFKGHILWLTCLILSFGGCDSKPKDNGFTWPHKKKERRGSFSSLTITPPIENHWSMLS